MKGAGAGGLEWEDVVIFYDKLDNPRPPRHPRGIVLYDSTYCSVMRPKNVLLSLITSGKDVESKGVGSRRG